ncbi:MAG TPA: flagellar motor protein MotB [Cyanobacteria bacterium UBA8803]|nr:flagellar motor protein MotB [Cyanobacteria bacterium UBA9273]HBL58769.1 flagellar motor protein MotB [Cyanobacteria bacterium UBA8803]
MASSQENRSALSQLEGLLDLLIDLQTSSSTGEPQQESQATNQDETLAPVPRDGDRPSQIDAASIIEPQHQNAEVQQFSSSEFAELLGLPEQEEAAEEKGAGGRGNKNPSQEPANLASLAQPEAVPPANSDPPSELTSQQLIEPPLTPEPSEDLTTELTDNSTSDASLSAWESLHNLLSQSALTEESSDLSASPSISAELDSQQLEEPLSLPLKPSNGSLFSHAAESSNGLSILAEPDIQQVENSVSLSVKPSNGSMLSHPATLDSQQEETSANYPEPSFQLDRLSVETSSSSLATDDTDPDNSITAFEQLQRLLLTPEIVDSREVLLYLKEKFTILEHQIYDPSELIKLLLPLITEILSLKVVEAREEMAQAIAPIIDEMIQAKAQQDKSAISSALAPVLPDAVTQQVYNSPGDFAKALAPEMGKAIKEQIDLERDAMVDALYPVIGSTISKYMAEAVAAINQKVENTLSPEGVARKVRARMQGVSEAELIFMESMPFTIQAIFLIHKASGLVIAEVQPFGKQRLESEMVAGMLTAIRSFVNDCIAQSGNISELDRIDYGDCEIVLEVAGYCYLAVVTQGSPPKSFLEKMREALSTIVQRHGVAIELFDGDPTQVPKPVQQFLESLTEVSKPSTPKSKGKPPVALFAISLAVLSLIFIPWSIHRYRSGAEQDLEDKTSLALASEPELAVYRLTVDAKGDTLKLSGKLPNTYLVEKAEQIAKTVAPTVKIDNEIVAVKVPPDAAVVAAEVERVTSILNEMERVAIWTTYSEGKVKVEGSAIQVADAQKITEAFEKIPGVESVTNTVQLQPLALASRIYFDLNSAELRSSELKKINQLKLFLEDYPTQHIRLIGHSDKSGNMLENQGLALERAKTVAEALVNQGIDARRLEVSGTTKPPTGVYTDDALNLSRFVEFEAIAP